MRVISKQILNRISESSSHTQRVNLIRSEFIGTRKRKGSARLCIPLDEKWVLKIARNEKGLAQNLFEAECYKYSSTYEKRYLAKVKDWCKDGTWLIQQRVKPLSYEKGQRLRDQLLQERGFTDMIDKLGIHHCDIDQIGIIGKQYKIFDYGLSKSIARIYYYF